MPCDVALQNLRTALPRIVVLGARDASRALITDGDNGDKYKIMIEGKGLRKVMTTVGINGAETSTNNISDVYKTLGIEAARNTIIHEVEVRNPLDFYFYFTSFAQLFAPCNIFTTHPYFFFPANFCYSTP